jgi:acetyl-CoA synthetase
MFAPHVLPSARDYETLYDSFRWQIPAHYNIGVDVCDRWAAREPRRTAIFNVRRDASVDEIGYGVLRERSNRLANVLATHGIGRGDRIAILLPQMPEVAISHIAVYKLGAVALPLALLFGIEAISYRLADSGARAVITNAQGLAKLPPPSLPGEGKDEDVAVVLSVDGPADGAQDFHALLSRASPEFEPVATTADDPAMMIYTSGTTGPPKGALHAHRVLLGHLPGIELPHEFFPQPGDRFWTPADWAWAGGLLDALLPALHYGVPVVAHRYEKFDPGEAFHLMAELEVRNAFIPPTALRLMRSVSRPPAGLQLRSLGSGGEALGAETYEWGKSALGLAINEFYGQTECNLVLGSCGGIGVCRPGSIGKAVPGHTVAIIRPDGTPCARDEAGEIAIRRPDPVMFLEYWGNGDAAREKFIGDWMTTGDQGVMDRDGYVQFVGRNDDVITSSGYRIGPTEIEDCLIKHPAVALAAVVGKPDPVRTQIVKAFIVPKAGHSPSDALAAEIQSFVKTRLSAHEYPREVAFIDAMPMTTTGKVIRRLLRQQA